MPGRSPDADFGLVDNHQTPRQVVLGDRIEEARQSCFRHLDRGRPNPQTNDASVGAGGVHRRIGKVLIEGDDNRAITLRPIEDSLVRRAPQPHVVDVPNLPLRLALPRKLAYRLRDVLIEQDAECQCAMTWTSSTTSAAYAIAATTSSRPNSG